MNTNPHLGEASLRRRGRPPVEDRPEDDEELEARPDEGEADEGDLDEGDLEEGDKDEGADFEGVELSVRQLSAKRCVIGVDIDLDFDREVRIDADDVEDLIEAKRPAKEATPARPAPKAARAAPMAARAAPMAAPAAQAKPRGRWKINRKKFFAGYNAAFPDLTKKAREGLDQLLSAAEADRAITDIRWLAYMLATVLHECGGEWRPIKEYSRGKGMKYGRPVVVKDPQGRKYRNVYYGRGYVQLTWDYNYRKMGKLLKNRLLYKPSLALQPRIAYQILSIGMRRGLFTPFKLGDYIKKGRKADYYRARKIINGLDRAQLLAKYAVKFERILRRSAKPVAQPRPTEPS